MLFVGTDDGVYEIAGVREPGETTAERLLNVDRPFRVRQFDGLDGLFVTTSAGLYYSLDGRTWTRLSVPEASVYAVAVDPSGDKLYAGTRPARLFVADAVSLPTNRTDWTEVEGFRAVRDRSDWGISRHDDVAQVRSLRTDPSNPERIVAGVEVGGVYVTDDGGETWADRSVGKFDAPHTDDVHHVALGAGDAVVASTGSGLYRSPDAGWTWQRLDEESDQRYFREAFVEDGVVYAGGSPAHPATWETRDDHALFECRDGRTLKRVSSPVPDEVAVGWCRVGDDVVAATHRGTLLRCGGGGWERIGSVPTPGNDPTQSLSMTWVKG
ncbi:WD40 repeat domain-containing protein [Halogeometricum borinquense]|uniref:WD40 repeat domain-containing protein n=1 Tax=Halogeometricum borinquense TaxID=60847 RepID=A0A6C0UJ23_9EURY|nr:WD40 repeat domain-containing protein [Halogeometricum borinquense]QIB73849.1 WD40 repeat domain-containing protein [Halogeometricum borinquense]